MYNSSSKNLSERSKDTNKDILLVQSFQTMSSLCCKPIYWNRMYQFFERKKKNNLLKKRCKVHDVKGFHLVLIAYDGNIAM
jgi:hypothetical protein